MCKDMSQDSKAGDDEAREDFSDATYDEPNEEIELKDL